jgi:hypothetical protein
VESDCERETMFLEAGEFSQTSPPCPEKLRTVPGAAAARLPLMTCQPPLLAAALPAGAPDANRFAGALPKECHWPSATAGRADDEFPNRWPPAAMLPPGRDSL